MITQVVAIIGGITYWIFTARYKAQSRTAKQAGDLRGVVEANTVANQQLLKTLENMDARLARVEKTLTDIPWPT